jgi:hypothetical protein
VVVVVAAGDHALVMLLQGCRCGASCQLRRSQSFFAVAGEHAHGRGWG